jgi:ankyrin repeat protein
MGKDEALHCACNSDTEDLPTVVALLEDGADVHYKDYGWMTPLHWAARWGHIQTVQLLLEKGAKIESKDSAGRTPLHFAAVKGYLKMMEFLLEKGAEIDSKDDYGCPPLHEAAGNGRTKLVKLLLEKGAEIDSKDINGSTPLLHAARNKRGDAIKVLLANGADKNIKVTSGLYKDKSPVDMWPEFFRELENNLKQDLFSLMLCWERKTSMIGDLPKDVVLYLVKVADSMNLLGLRNLKRKRV